MAQYPYNGGLVHNLVRLPVNMFSLVTGIREKGSTSTSVPSK